MRIRFLSISLAAAILSLLMLGRADAADVPVNDPGSDWNVALGGGVYDHHKFPGSNANNASPVPYVDIRYGNNWFFNSVDGLGIKTSGDSNCWLSLSVGPDLTHRDMSDDPRLTGLGDVKYAGRVWAKSSSSWKRFTATTMIGADITGKGQGTIADFEFYAHHYPSDKWEIDDGTGFRWANAEYMGTFFGVSAQQSLSSGLPQYSAGSGITSVDAFFRVRYAITNDWMLVYRLQWTRLEGDAVNSPITESRNRLSFGVFAVYGF